MDKEKLKARFEQLKKEHSAKLEYPSPLQMAKNLATSVVNNVKSVADGNSLSISKEDAQKRLRVCQQCDFYDSLQERCKKCGCKLAIKTYLKAEKCPIGKW
jgi:hypothetical protein